MRLNTKKPHLRNSIASVKPLAKSYNWCTFIIKRGEIVKREEAAALLRELATKQFVQPQLVLIDQRTPNSYQLKIKGDYDRELIEIFAHYKNLAVEEDNARNYLIVFEP